jgi:sugar lactone lactonase YvrE
VTRPASRLRWLVAFAPALALAPAAGAFADRIVYDDSLAAGWEEQGWSYGVTTDLANPAPVHAGTASVAVTLEAPYGALSLRISPPLSTTGYTALRLWVRGSGGGTSVGVYTQSADGGAAGPIVTAGAPATPWTELTVPLASLGAPAEIARISVQDESGSGAGTFYVDDVSLVGSGAAGIPDPVADRVLGQTRFDSDALGMTASTLYGPAGVAIGPDGRLFVTDYENHRVLAWNDAAHRTSGSPADLVLGQPDFTSHAPGTSSAGLTHPEGVTVDPQGNVFVADTDNHRVLLFEPPLTNGMSGIPFGSMNCNTPPTLDELCYPRAMATDAAGNLYLADEFHDRILIYRTPVAGGDLHADLSIDGLSAPRGLAVDAQGNVYASDSENDRVLEYDQPLATDTVPDRTFGDGPDGVDCFTAAVPPGITGTTLACPIDLAVDAAGDLFVSDLYHNRVLVFRDARGGDGIPDAVFGQAGSFTTGDPNHGGIGAASIDTPLGLAFDPSGNLYLADFANDRVLVYDAPVPEPGALAGAAAVAAALVGLAARRRPARCHR